MFPTRPLLLASLCARMSDCPSTSSDPVAVQSRPAPVPHPVRQQQPSSPPPKQNSLANLLAAKRSNGATPIPPSLQAKMAAVSTPPSLPLFPLFLIALPSIQMANRASQAHTQSSPNIDTVTAVMHRAAIDSHLPPASRLTPPVIPEHPSLRAAQSYPLPGILRTAAAAPPRTGGMAARRMKPNFSLKDINADFAAPSLGGASAAGLGAGRPSLADSPIAKRPPPVGSPFSNFSKIVYVPCPRSITPSNIHHPATPLVPSTFQAKQSYTLPVSTFQTAPLSLSTCPSSNYQERAAKAARPAY